MRVTSKLLNKNLTTILYLGHNPLPIRQLRPSDKSQNLTTNIHPVYPHSILHLTETSHPLRIPLQTASKKVFCTIPVFQSSHTLVPLAIQASEFLLL